MTDNFTTFYLVRHGTTEWNEKKLIQGQLDSPLTQEGLKQAKKLNKKFKNVKFNKVFSSDLLRAKKTAEITTLEKNLAIETSKLLRERSFGRLEGKSEIEFKKWREAFEKLTDEERFTYKHFPEIESDEEMSTRFLNFLRQTAIGLPGKTILIVTHGGIIRTFLVKIGFANYSNLKTGAVKNGAFVKLKTDGTDFFVKEVSGVTLSS